MFSTSALCYEDRKMNVRSIATDLHVHILINLKMSECPFFRDAGHCIYGRAQVEFEQEQFLACNDHFNSLSPRPQELSNQGTFLRVEMKTVKIASLLLPF